MRYLTIIALLLGGLSLSALTACNTAKGFGQDVQDSGEYIEDKAEEASD
jgi:predicted small secreted protein